MSMGPTIWVLCDDRAGNVSQCLGVAEALDLPFEQKDIAYNGLAKLPNFLLGTSLQGLNAQSKSQIKAPWPDLVIAAGRRTAPIARHIKKASKGKCKIVQVMYPGNSGADDFDLICVPSHDQNSYSANEMTMTGAPHRVNQQKLNEAVAHWLERFSFLPQPRIGLIVGGATKNKAFSADMGKELGRKVNDIAKAKGASVLVTTSRRTGEAAEPLLEEITVPSFKFKFGDEGENPYFGFLALSDVLIVTGDSVSMCSEACATGKPVYIYAPEGMISEKHKRMVASLYEGGYAYPFAGSLDMKLTNKLNTTHEIAERIREIL
ncbi:Predicted nucleoside-diphosphate-sugar epimerase [Candidatus Terasakiella magnetica]|uniref:Predicted nucleoside-diphosphate-sugar epimerase n=1 Tax=Candidatus Terasakiella magnetica TaxID=1867952 RepID=A0A1C3RI46_9PROT|nr:mitochondrial fission ELM1 family protein [Candidatus Terasakiella magnetica]SCA56961.1 Predicted nucleoside-diphosphate-sugar epimerase [Candidatus Terasakiella magnetica]